MAIDRRMVHGIALATALLLLLASCSRSKQPISVAQTAPRGDVTTCAKYEDSPTRRAQCLLLTGPNKQDFIPEIGRRADLNTQLRCHPIRSSVHSYARCLGLESQTGSLDQEQWSSPASVPAATASRTRPSMGPDASTYVTNLVVCLSAEQPGACQHGLLTPAHMAQVRQIEYRTNLTRCLLGETPCEQGGLTALDAERVRQSQAPIAAMPSLAANGPLGVVAPRRAREQNKESSLETGESLTLWEPRERVPVVSEQPALSDAEIRKELVRQSIALYPGSCPCPHNLDRGGRRCGGRSAYSRPGGRSPICYDSDVTQAMVESFRDQERAP
jgi:hypothetical protein